MCEKGVIEEVSHCQGEYISPIFTRKKKDGSFRVILNLKQFNENVKYHHFKMESIYSVLNMVKQGCFMASVDLKDAYYSVPIAQEQRKFLRFQFKGKLFQYTCFPNGLACCPRLFTKLLKPVYKSLREKGCEVAPYIDDSYIQGDTENECWQSAKQLALLLQSLGFIIHPEKSIFTPSKELLFLGFLINSEHMTVTLTKEKSMFLKQSCLELLSSAFPSIRCVARVIGLMISSAPAIELAMLYYRALENDKVDALKQNFGNFDSQMTLSPLSKADLLWWVNNVEKTSKKISQSQPDVVITTDASKEGWGAVLGSTSTGGRWSPDECIQHINVLELEAVYFGLKSLCSEMTNTHIRVMSDNTTTVCYINNMGGSKSRPCNTIARKIWDFVISKNNTISAAHLPGKQNQLADKESRVFSDRTEWMLNRDIFNTLSQMWGPFEVDMFASRLNKQINTYISWKPEPDAWAIDAFSVVWDQYFYAFPPFCLIDRCLQKISQDQADGLIIVPMWPTQTFYPILMSMLTQQPRLLPKNQNLLKLCHSPASHPLWKKMQLIACLVSGKSWKQVEFRQKLETSCYNHGGDQREPNMEFISGNGHHTVVKGTLIPMISL